MKDKITLYNMYKAAEEVASQWNGDSAGKEEDAANIAEEIMFTINRLRELTIELEELA